MSRRKNPAVVTPLSETEYHNTNLDWLDGWPSCPFPLRREIKLAKEKNKIWVVAAGCNGVEFQAETYSIHTFKLTPFPYAYLARKFLRSLPATLTVNEVRQILAALPEK